METDKTQEYNGHRNWVYWNVALWLGNDESLYRAAMSALRRCTTVDRAAAWLLSELIILNITETPDGAVYTKNNLKAALRGLK